MFPSTLRLRNLKTQRSPVIWDFFLRQGNHIIIVVAIIFEEVFFKILLRPCEIREEEKPSNSSRMENVQINNEKI